MSAEIGCSERFQCSNLVVPAQQGMTLSLQVVVMHAQNLEAANTDLLPAAQVELRAIYADEEIAFQKTTVHPESKTPVLFSIWLEMSPLICTLNLLTISL